MILKPKWLTKIEPGHWAAKGLICSLLFNEGGGDLAYDLSGNGNHGTLVGDARSVSGKFGSVIDCAANGDYIDTGNDYFEGLAQITIVIWCRANVASPGVLATLCSNWGSGTDTIKMERTGHSPLPRTIFSVTTTTGSANARGANIADTGWHQWAGVYDGENVLLYIDGIPGVPVALTGVTQSSTNSLKFSYSNPAWLGQIGYASVYNRGLNFSEIMSLYLNPYQTFKRGG